jgi:hypothetical protein
MYTGITAFASMVTAAVLARVTVGKENNAETISVFILVAFTLGGVAVFTAPRILNRMALLNRWLTGPGQHRAWK